MTDCPFCQMKDTIFENEYLTYLLISLKVLQLAQAFYDAYPVSEGHMLIRPNKTCVFIF